MSALTSRSERLLADLRGLAPSALRDEYIAFVTRRGEASLRRDGGAEHLTGSCVVVTPDRRRVLLTHHRKGRFWVQFGGHVEPEDASLAAAAQREAREESGIADLVLASDAIADLDRHTLGPGFSCAVHWDVGFVAFAREDAAVAVSDESVDVRWFDVDALPPGAVAGLAERIDTVLARV